MPDFSLADILGAQAGAPGPVYEGGPTGNVTLADVLGPAWLERAQKQAQADAAAYQRGGVPELLADTGQTQELAGGFGGNIKAYHGSPYDFARFDLSRIGTGEGAQAYGHGLYFAENPAVATQYRDALSSSGVSVKPGFDYNPTELGILNRAIQQNKGADIAALLQEQEAAYRARGEPIADSIASARKNLEAGNYTPLPPGKMYEVNINAKPEQFLDWEKALKDQPAGQSILNRPPYELGYPRIKPESIGQDAYYKMAGDLKQLDSPNAHAAASEYLKSQGIPGIKYLDQGSRGAQQGFYVQSPASRGDYFNVIGPGNISHGQFPSRAAASEFATARNTEGQTSNYVVFNPDIVDILKKYGLAGMLGGSTMAGVLQAQSEPPAP